MPPTIVVVGASLAGASAAAALRQEGFDGDITLIGAERHLPYERPPLSKQYLRGEAPFEKSLVRPAAFYEQNRITALLGVSVTAVKPVDGLVELDTGGRVRYDKLLIATGVRNRRPPIPGLELGGVFDLRSVDDANRLRDEIAPGRRAVVVGMGFIGAEVAATLRQKGVAVVSVDPAPTPLFHALGEDVGRVVAEIHRERGVHMISGDVAARFEGDERIERVVTKKGLRIDCDFAVIGVGVEPVTELALGSGIAIDNGIVVDEHCRSTVDGIFAAGDVANHYHPVFERRMRVEHWQNAVRQGAAAARSMLGKPQPYDDVHWFWSDQYETNLQYAGSHRDSNQAVIRGSLDGRKCLAFYLNEGRIDAVAAVNWGKELRRAMPLIKARATVDARRLEDQDVDLRSLLRAEAGRGGS